MGFENATSKAFDVAINHDAEAVRMHAANHPATQHLCSDVFEVHPLEATEGRPVRLLWGSPDCTDFSRAKGAKPVRKNIRGLAWVLVRWAREVRPRMIILENVREFEGWGPLVWGRDKTGKPVQVRDPKREGLTFRRWVGCLRNLGYTVEWKVLNAADYGAPTHRRRLFVVARCDGEPITWPEPTHADAKKSSGRLFRLKPYRTAAECIDWSIPCPSIFDRKRPLAEKTLRRIAMGIQRYVLEAAEPFIVQVNHGGDEFRGQATHEPLTTVSAKHGYGVVSPTLVQTGYGERPGQAPRTMPVDQPLGTVVSGGKHALVAATLQQFFGGMIGKPLTDPMPTVTETDHNALAAAHLVKFRGDSKGTPVDQPMPTITGGAGAERLAGAAHALGVSAASIVRLCQQGSNGNNVNPPDKPLTTITSKAEHCLAAACLARFSHGEKQWNGVTEPLCTITSQGNKFGIVAAFLVSYFGQGIGQDILRPMRTVTVRDRFGLVQLEIEPGRSESAVALFVPGIGPCIIADIGLRMLMPRELFRAQGFPDTYILTGSKSSQVARCGNSVPPPLAEAVIRSNVRALEAIAA